MSDIPLTSFNATQYVEELKSYGEVGLCLLDSVTGSWWHVLEMRRCFNWSRGFEDRVVNTLVGVADIAHITAGFAFLFFLRYMIKPTPQDAHHHITIFSWKDMPTLKEAVKKDSMLPFLLASNRVAEPASDDVLITAEKLGLNVSFESFHVTKEVYNRIAKQHDFRQVK